MRSGVFKIPLQRALTEAETKRSLTAMHKIIKRMINGVVEQVDVEEFLWERADGGWEVVTRTLDKRVVGVRPATPEDRTPALL